MRQRGAEFRQNSLHPPMCRPFVHLHNHTEYSLLDGANRIPQMVSRCKELGMESLAITDHGVMFGVMEFHNECRSQGIKPIIGMEAYVAPGGRHKKSGKEENESYHLLLLAKNATGYKNLCKLATIAALEGYYYRPRVDHELLKEYSEGLISSSTCLGSEVNQALLQGDYEKAQRLAGMYAEIFGQENYFIELQDHGLFEQAKIKDDLVRISRELKLPLIATNDAHYLCKTDAKPHDVLLCIQTGSLVAEEKRMKFEGEEFYLKSQEEMSALFTDHPEAIENTAMVADMCDLSLAKAKAPTPDPNLPPGYDSRRYLRELAHQNLPKRIRGADERALERLDYELSVIEQTGFESYFLLVREFAQYSRDNGIYFGVRGSAAGSLVSYCLGITDIDPLEYDLTFERFLNIERIAMPDVDMDFEDARRDEVIRYVTERFGQDRVAQIVTFGTLGAKAAIKDCGRVLGYTPQETDKICKTIPNVPGMTLEKAMEDSAEFKAMVASDQRVADLVETAKSVEGTARHCGVHAAGIVISNEPLSDFIPLYRGNDNQAITAYDMGILEKIGMLKMDFLGLSNLTVLARAEGYIRQLELPDDHPLRTGSMQDIPLDDEKAFELLGAGNTVGIFQLESSGMTQYVRELKPRSVKELAAMVALYRPGPIKHIPQYIDSKFGRIKPQYLDDKMTPILEETYGVIVFQDQVLQLVRALAGFTLGAADVLRRAMGKKDAVAMAEMYDKFVAGCAANGVTKQVADKVWELLMPFAGYAFNKAHSVCYAMLAYQTAYLKANFPVEFMAALLAVYRDKEDRVVACIEECRRMKIQVLPPDVNRSQADFVVERDAKGRAGIRFGLAAIKGVGEGLVECMLKERSEAPFRHLYEFADRMKPNGMNRTALEALIKAGALDSIDRNRRKLLEVADGALAFADAAQRHRQSGQESLFGESEPSTPTYPVIPEMDMLSRGELLAMEKEVMGIYVSDHPLRGFERAIQAASNASCAQVAEQDDGKSVKLAGVIAKLQTSITKKTGRKMATFQLEDFSGQATVVVYPGVYDRLGPMLERDKVVQITGYVSHRERLNSSEKSVEVSLGEISQLDQMSLHGLAPSGPMLLVEVSGASVQQLRKLSQVAERHPGTHELCLQVLPANRHPIISTGLFVDGTNGFGDELRVILPSARIESSPDTLELPEDSLAGSAS